MDNEQIQKIDDEIVRLMIRKDELLRNNVFYADIFIDGIIQGLMWVKENI